MYRYKLQEADYEDVWLLLTPEEIYNEFQERACSPRNIRRIYKQNNLSHRNKKKGLVELKYEEAFWNKREFDEALKELKDEAIERIWHRVRRIEEEWHCMS
tara:strand:- start:431 stop:733 length:303 start_codon:yes stop_codon:yes gene_type:complete